MTAQWFDYTPESIEEWLEWLAEHPYGDEGDGLDGELADSDAVTSVSPDASASAPPTTARPLMPALPKWHGYESDVVFLAPYEDVPLLIPDLDIGLGRPTGIWGAPGAGKSDMVQALALAVMSGKPAFGRFPIAHRPNSGRVVHLTYDMGLRATALRYRRLANGMGLTPQDVEGKLLLCAHPPITLTSAGAARAFRELLEGCDLAILDNVRGASPGVDENDSRFGELLSLYGAAAESAGCVPLYLHHTRKGKSDGRADGIDLARGSSAIVAASGCVWLIEGQRDEPRHVRQLRMHDSSDGPRPEFVLVRHPAPPGPNAFDVGTRPSWRLLAVPSASGNGVRDRVLRALTRGPAAITALRRAVGGDAKANAEQIKAVLDDLEREGLVRVDGKQWRLA